MKKEESKEKETKEEEKKAEKKSARHGLRRLKYPPDHATRGGLRAHAGA